MARSMLLILVRHGESAHNLAELFAGSIDSPLTPAGLDQAVQLGVYLAARADKLPPITHVYASDLQRASDTAKAIAAGCAAGVAVQQYPELRERCLGDLQDQPKDIKVRHGGRHVTAVEAIRLGIVGIESRDAMLLRARRFVEGPLARAWAEEDAGGVIIASHGGFLQILYSVLVERVGQVAAGDDVDEADLASPMWGNTAYLEAVIEPGPGRGAVVANGLVTPPDDVEAGGSAMIETARKSPVLGTARMVVKRVGCTEHLSGAGAKHVHDPVLDPERKVSSALDGL